MIINEIYCYERETGKITVSTEKPNCEHIIKYRLIADENKQLTRDGINFVSCIDVETDIGWYEIDNFDTEESSLAPDEISPEEFMALVEEALS